MDYIITDAHIDETLARIKQKEPYIDKVTIWLDTSSHMLDLKGIKELCGGYVNESHKPMRQNSKWRCKIELLQPSREAFIFIKNQTSASYLINHFEPALDYVTGTYFDAEAVHDFFKRTMVKKWHRKKHIKKYDTGIYFSPRKSTANLVGYYGKPSKVNDKPCCHIEMRFKTSAAVRRAGIDSLDALIGFDHYGFWKKYLNLRRLDDLEKLDRAVLREYPKAFKARIRKKAAAIFLRGYAQVGDEYNSFISAQAIIDNGTSYKKCLSNIPNDAFLP